MQFHAVIVCNLLLRFIINGEILHSYSDQYGVIGDLSQQENISKQSSTVQQSTKTQISQSSSRSNTNYLVGNLSESFSFNVAPSSSKVRHLGFNGYSLYIMGAGSPNDSRFKYDENNNRLTILSLDTNTVGYYLAVDANWNTFINVVSAINVSSFEISNFHVNEDNNGSTLVSCSVSIIRSIYKLAESSLQPNDPFLRSAGTENLPRLDLFISTQTLLSVLSNKKIHNDKVDEQHVTRLITVQRSLTRADHNGTIQCQIESNDNLKIYLIKTVLIDVEYGPNLETGALTKVYLESEESKKIEMECQIEANPSPSYVWYEISRNITTIDTTTDNDQQMSYQRLTSIDQNVFGTKRQITRTYESLGQYAMLCQAQSRGKTVKQEFFINIHPKSNLMKANVYKNDDRQKSYKFLPMFGIIIASIFLLLIFSITTVKIIALKQRKPDPNEEHSNSTEKLPNDKQGKSRWGSLPIDYSKYKHESLKTDSSSTSHLVESAETNSMQGTTIRSRPSPIISTNSSYRQTPLTSVSLSYRQASALPGFRTSNSTHYYSPEQDEIDETNININGIPLAINRSRTTTPFGSHKSLSESVQSLKSNQQPVISLPVKKRSNDPPPILSRQEQNTESPNLFQAKQDYQHHHYHNPAQLRAQQKIKVDNMSSEGEGEGEFEQQQTNPTSDDLATTGSTAASLGYNQVDFHSEYDRQIIKSPLTKQTVGHQTTGAHRDEAPPPYHQIINASSPSQVYMYQEPTEV